MNVCFVLYHEMKFLVPKLDGVYFRIREFVLMLMFVPATMSVSVTTPVYLSFSVFEWGGVGRRLCATFNCTQLKNNGIYKQESSPQSQSNYRVAWTSCNLRPYSAMIECSLAIIQFRACFCRRNCHYTQHFHDLRRVLYFIKLRDSFASFDWLTAVYGSEYPNTENFPPKVY